MSATIRVLIADDQRVIREGLTLLLGLLPGVEVIGAASDGEEALALAAALVPDVVLMDLRMPRCDGVEATRRLRQSQPACRVVVLTTYADDRSVVDALRAGARGFLTKAPAPRRSSGPSRRSSRGGRPSTRPSSTMSWRLSAAASQASGRSRRHRMA